MSKWTVSLAARRLICCVAVVCAAVMARPAQAAFHLWGINEVYTNASGSLQFIELQDSFGGQNFVGGTSIQAFNVGATLNNLFTLPGVTLPGNTFGRSLLFGTAGLAAAGGPTPDFIIPNGFLFSAGGSINFFGLNSGAYAALPTDGILSRNWVPGTNSVNSPTNYAGQTGTVPAPTTLAIALAGGWISTRRRR